MLKVMKRPFLAATVLAANSLLAISATSDSARAIVIGSDNRVTPSYNFMLASRRQPIGRLEIQGADGLYYSCSFTVVGRNIGLTNTHCLLDAQGRGPRQVKAFALQHGNRVYASANVDLYWTGLKTAPVRVGDQVRDWAVVRFTTNLGDRTGWFGNVGWNLNINQAGQSVVQRFTNLVGYSGDWPTAAAIQPGQVRGRTPGGHFTCQFLQVQAGVVLHNCDTNPGASGSGIHNNTRQLMGLHFGWVPLSNGTRMNGAVPLERFMPAVQKLRSTGAASSTLVPVP